jgi:hypothetical protein
MPSGGGCGLACIGEFFASHSHELIITLDIIALAFSVAAFGALFASGFVLTPLVIELLAAGSAASITGAVVTILSDASPRDKYVVIATNFIGVLPTLAVPADLAQLVYDIQNP